MVLRRMIAVPVLAVAAMLALAAPALAHAELIDSNPKKDASLDTPPKQLQLTFNEPVSPMAIGVTGPQGAQWTVGQVSVEGAVVTAPVQAVGPAGPYMISYAVRSGDGDDVTGTINFTMTVAATITTTTATTEASEAAPTPSPSPQAAQGGDDSGGIPAWVWIIVALAVLIAAGTLLLRRTRSRTQAPAPDATEPAAPAEDTPTEKAGETGETGETEESSDGPAQR